MEINYACSLGTLCHGAQILKQNNLKFCSYPFDWIYSNCDNIIHCIEDDFKIFLDKSYYISISTKSCGHSRYNVQLFNHHNPLDDINDYNYYVRCVDRFKKMRQCEGHKLFVIIFIGLPNIETVDKNYIIEFNRKFSQHTTNYTLLVIFHIINKQKNRHTFTYNDNIHFLELNTL